MPQLLFGNGKLRHDPFQSGANRLHSTDSPAIAARHTSSAGIAQKAVHRLTAHNGAAASGLGGGYSGYREGGIPGRSLAVPLPFSCPTDRFSDPHR
jgi:hypothetical protein